MRKRGRIASSARSAAQPLTATAATQPGFSTTADAGNLFGRRLVDADQLRVAVRTVANGGMDHVGQAHVGGMHGRAIDLGRQIDTRHRLARKAASADRAERDAAGGIELRRLGRQFAEAEAIIAAGDEAGGGVARRPVRAPAFAGGGARSARAMAPASRKRCSKPRIELDPPVTISAERMANWRAAQPPTPFSRSGIILPPLRRSGNHWRRAG